MTNDNTDEQSNGRVSLVLKRFGDSLTLKHFDAISVGFYDGLALVCIGITALYAMVAVPSTGVGPVDLIVSLGCGITVGGVGLIWVFVLTPDEETAFGHIWTRFDFLIRTRLFSANAQVIGTGNVRDIVSIENIHDYHDPMIESLDGDFSAMSRVHGEQMALANNNAWAQSSQSFGDLVNALDSSFEVHAPGRTIDTARMAGDMDERLGCEDVSRNTDLKQAVLDHRDKLPQALEEQGMNIREYYVGVNVSEQEIRQRDSDTLGLISDVPILGRLMVWLSFSVIAHVPVLRGTWRRLGLLDRPKTRKEVQLEQRRQVRDSLNDITADINDIGSLSAHHIDADGMMDLTQEFWTGKRVYSHSTSRMNRPPVVLVRDDGYVAMDEEASESFADEYGFHPENATDDDLTEIDGLDISDPEMAIEQIEREQDERRSTGY